MKETENPIALKSKKWIVEALFKLMEEKEYIHITVKDIAKRADLDRRTFYRNFQDKDDVLCFYIKGMCIEYIDALKLIKNPSTFLTAKTYFMICLNHLTFLGLLNKCGLLGFLLTKQNEFMPKLQQRDLSPDIKAFYGDNLEYLYAFNNGGFWNLSIYWIQNGSIQTPDEMAAIVCKIIRGMSECSY